MKFHCDSCNTRYSIADERVRGKILKIRCKSCSAVITVREDADPGAGAGSPATRGKENEVAWYLSQRGQQVGPMKLPAARAWLAKQPSADGVFCWYDGFGDWKAVTQVAAFKDVHSGRASAPGMANRQATEIPPSLRAGPGRPGAAGPAAARPSQPRAAGPTSPRPQPGARAQNPRPRTMTQPRGGSGRQSAPPARPSRAATRPSAPGASRAQPGAAKPNSPLAAMADRPATPRPQAASPRPLTPAPLPRPPTPASLKPSPLQRPSSGPANQPPASIPASASLAPLPGAASPMAPRPQAAVAPAPTWKPTPQPVAVTPQPSPVTLQPAAHQPAPALPQPAAATPQPAPASQQAGPAAAEPAANPPQASASAEALTPSGPEVNKTNDPFAAFDDDGLDLEIAEPSRVVKLDVLMAGRDIGMASPRRAALPGVKRATMGVPAITEAAKSEKAFAPSFPNLNDDLDDELSPAVPASRRRGSTIVLIAILAILAIGAATLAFLVLSSDDSGDKRVAGGVPGQFENLGQKIDRPGGKRTDGDPGDPDNPDVVPVDDPKNGSSKRKVRNKTKKRNGKHTDDKNNGTSGTSPSNTTPTDPPATDDPDSQKPFNPDDVIRKSNRSQISFKRCHERAKKKDPFLEVSSIKIDIKIDKTGKVADVKLSNMAGTYIGNCLTGTVKRWKFRASTEGINTQLAVKFGR